MRARRARKEQKALDRLHGRNAKPSRSRGGSGGGGSDWGDVIGDVIGGLIESLFKIFD